MITTNDFDAATSGRWRYVRNRVEIAHEWAPLANFENWVECAHCGMAVSAKGKPSVLGCIGHTVDGRTVSARDSIVVS